MRLTFIFTWLITCNFIQKWYQIKLFLGCDSKKALSCMEVYDLHKDQWEFRSSMNEARHALSFTELNGWLYAIGGGNFTTEEYSSAERYDPIRYYAYNHSLLYHCKFIIVMSSGLFTLNHQTNGVLCTPGIHIQKQTGTSLWDAEEVHIRTSSKWCSLVTCLYHTYTIPFHRICIECRKRQ